MAAFRDVFWGAKAICSTPLLNSESLHGLEQPRFILFWNSSTVALGSRIYSILMNLNLPLSLPQVDLSCHLLSTTNKGSLTGRSSTQFP
eukprot:2968427-Amphidinium_carterae.1